MNVRTGPLEPAPPADLEGDGAALWQTCGELGLAASAAQVGAMQAYLALLRRWNQTYNLTAIRDPKAMLTHHLADCLAAVAALERAEAAAAGRSQGAKPTGAERILDVGSGGGLPGVLLAIFRPTDTVICLDAVAKKVAFVRQIAGSLGLPNLHAEHARIEQWRGQPCDVITARAFATLADLTRLTGPLLAEGGRWMAMKGQTPDSEIAELTAEAEVFHVERILVPGLDAQRCIVWMRRRRDT